MSTKNGIHTLASVIIVNPTQANLFPQFAQLKDLMSLMQLKLKKGFIVIDTPLISSSF
jgi:hypothetical protein